MRIISIVLTELMTDKLKCEERLERLINSKDEIDSTVSNIKTTLHDIALLDEMIAKWNTYTTAQNNNNVGNVE